MHNAVHVGSDMSTVWLVFLRFFLMLCFLTKPYECKGLNVVTCWPGVLYLDGVTGNIFTIGE